MIPLDNTSTHRLSNYEVEIMSSVASDDLTGNSLLPPITTTTLIAFFVRESCLFSRIESLRDQLQLQRLNCALR